MESYEREQKIKTFLKGRPKETLATFDGGRIEISASMDFSRDGKPQHIDPNVRVFGAGIPKGGSVITEKAVVAIIDTYENNPRFAEFFKLIQIEEK